MLRDTPPAAGLVLAGEEATPATTARLRLAQELHDTIASAIVVIGVQAGVADQALDYGEAGRERAREALRTIRTASRQPLEDLQATVATLRRTGCSGIIGGFIRAIGLGSSSSSSSHRYSTRMTLYRVTAVLALRRRRMSPRKSSRSAWWPPPVARRALQEHLDPPSVLQVVTDGTIQAVLRSEVPLEGAKQRAGDGAAVHGAELAQLGVPIRYAAPPAGPGCDDDQRFRSSSQVGWR
jgi:Histidine kinase